MYTISNDYFELVSGTKLFTSPVYKEAVENAEKGTSAGVSKLRKFLNSIDNLAKKPSVKDNRISSSKGNIKNFSGYEDIKHAIEFLNKNLSGVSEVKDCVKVFDALENWTSLYQEAYDKDVRIVVLEYENAVYMLCTSLSSIIATNIDVVSNGTEIRIQKKSASTHGVIQKTMKDLATQLGNRDHKGYLEEMIKVHVEDLKESVLTEGTVGDVAEVLHIIGSGVSAAAKIGYTGVEFFKKVKKSLFGIIPLIRSVIYLRYKKKADTIVALEEQMVFVSRNIEQLENMKNMDPTKKAIIIKKQKAYIEAYRKKSEKLRAELMETEKQATQELDKDNESIKEKDDDLVLEAAVFTEGGRHLTNGEHVGPPKNFMKASRKLTSSDIAEVRNDKRADQFLGIFGKKSAKEEPKNEADENARKTVKSAAEKVHKESVRKSIRLIPGKDYTEDDPTKLKATKLGGTPYWPASKIDEWPKCNGKTMICLAQLNLDKLPKLEGFPTTGLLQFFIVDEVTYDRDDYQKVVYWEKYDEEPTLDVPDTNLKRIANKEYLAIEKVYYPEAKVEEDYINYCSDNLRDLIAAEVGKLMGNDWNKYKDVTDDNIRKFIDDAVWDENNKMFYPSWRTRIGGWPAYTQSEPSYVDDDTVQLIQLDSESEMMWGDCGIAHFFIQKDDLTKKDFSKTKFTWDCC